MVNIIIVKGDSHEWGVKVPDRMVADLRADGIEVMVGYWIPAWAEAIGLARVFIAAQDFHRWIGGTHD